MSSHKQPVCAFLVVLIFLNVAPSAHGAETPSSTGLLADYELGEPVDVLSKIDPRRDTKAGTAWTKENGKLISSEDLVTSLETPYEYPENYAIRAKTELKKQYPSETLGILLKVQDSHCHVYLNSWRGTCSGLHLLQKREGRDPNNPTHNDKFLVPPNNVSDLSIIVYQNRIIVAIDGKKGIDWEGNPADLSLHTYTRCKADGHLWLTTLKATWEISELTVTPITGLSTTQPAVATRNPVPSKGELREASKAVEDKHNVPLDTRSLSEKVPLAKRLVGLTLTETDPVNQYVLLSSAKELAVEGHDLALAWEIIDKLAASYEIDTRDEKLDALKSLSRFRRSPQLSYENARYAHQLAVDAFHDHAYDEAKELLSLAFSYSRSANVGSLTEQLTEQIKHWSEVEKQYETIASSHQTFLENPQQPEAATEWGEFLCFFGDDWKQGLAVLAKGTGDSANLARSEIEDSPGIDNYRAWIQKWKQIADAQSEPIARNSVNRHRFELIQSAYAFADPQQTKLLETYAQGCFGRTGIIDTSGEEKGISIGGANANIGPEATVEFWLKTADGNGWVIAKRDAEELETIGAHVRYQTIWPFGRAPQYMMHADSKFQINDSRWHHVALCKLGRELRLFVDGQSVQHVVLRDGFPKPSNSPWRIGYTPWLDDRKLDAEYARIRISSICRYHVPFTPQLDYENDEFTMLLR